MKSLSERQKEIAYKVFVDGPMRAVAQPLYGALVKTEIMAHRILDKFCDPGEGDDLTALNS